MPKKPMDYSKTHMYKIVCNDLNVKYTYIGHTTNFNKRKYGHKTCCNNKNDKHHNVKLYKTIREFGGWENWSMVEIEKYQARDVHEATARERYWYEQLNADLNVQVPNRSIKESQKLYNENNKETIKEKKKEYRENHKNEIKEYRELNKEKLKEMMKQYRELNKEILKEKKREFYQMNKEEVKEKRKAYRESHKEAIKESSREFYQINKEQIKEERRIYHQNNKDKINARKRELAKKKRDLKNQQEQSTPIV